MRTIGAAAPPLGRPGSGRRARVVILTITEREFANARRIFGLNVNVNGTSGMVAQLRDDNRYDVVLTQSLDRGNIAATEVRDIIDDWRPDYIFLCGTAGGVIDERTGYGREGTELGDVVVGNWIDDIEFGKLTPKGYERRFYALDHPSLRLRGDFALGLSTEPSAWTPHIGVCRPDETDKVPQVHFGHIAAGDRVWNAPLSKQQRWVMKEYAKSLAFEMETAGVARGVCKARRHPNYNIQYLTVRGISDFINPIQGVGQAQRDAWTDYACSAALAFAKVLVDRLLRADRGSL